MSGGWPSGWASMAGQGLHGSVEGSRGGLDQTSVWCVLGRLGLTSRNPPLPFPGPHCRRRPRLQHLWPAAPVQRPGRPQVRPCTAAGTPALRPLLLLAPFPAPHPLLAHAASCCLCCLFHFCSRTAGSMGVPGLADELAEPLLFCEMMVFGRWAWEAGIHARCGSTVRRAGLHSSASRLFSTDLSPPLPPPPPRLAAAWKIC